MLNTSIFQNRLTMSQIPNRLGGLREARDAAKHCLDNLEELFKTRDQLYANLDTPHNKATDLHLAKSYLNGKNLPSQKPFVRALLQCLLEGWPKIIKYWPSLGRAYLDLISDEKFGVPSHVPAPVEAWLLVRRTLDYLLCSICSDDQPRLYDPPIADESLVFQPLLHIHQKQRLAFWGSLDHSTPDRLEELKALVESEDPDEFDPQYPFEAKPSLLLEENFSTSEFASNFLRNELSRRDILVKEFISKWKAYLDRQITKSMDSDFQVECRSFASEFKGPLPKIPLTVQGVHIVRQYGIARRIFLKALTKKEAEHKLMLLYDDLLSDSALTIDYSITEQMQTIIDASQPLLEASELLASVGSSSVPEITWDDEKGLLIAGEEYDYHQKVPGSLLHKSDLDERTFARDAYIYSAVMRNTRSPEIIKQLSDKRLPRLDRRHLKYARKFAKTFGLKAPKERPRGAPKKNN
jgi:hypothetical protein